MERCFGDKSALLKHEVAYCLGQLGDARAVAKLVDVLADADNQVSVYVVPLGLILQEISGWTLS